MVEELSWGTQSDWQNASKTDLSVVGDTVTLASAIPDSAVARYEFEQDVTDSWGNNDGTDNTSAGYVTGTVGSYAKAFDGADDWVDIGTVLGSSPSAFSVACWVRTSNTSKSSMSLFRVRDGSSGDQINLSTVSVFSSGGPEWQIEDNGTFGTIRPGSGSDVRDGSWHHLIGTFDGSVLELYVDGSSVGTDSLSPSLSFSDAVAIGAFNDGEDGAIEAHHEGDIDDLRVYNKSLSDNEASNLESTGSIDG